jgi:hypothetical protein
LFLRFVTGSEHPPPAGYAAGYISVHFMDTDAVIGATCQLRLTLPTQFSTYREFSQSMMAVLPDGKKAFTMI